MKTNAGRPIIVEAKLISWVQVYMAAGILGINKVLRGISFQIKTNNFENIIPVPCGPTHLTMCMDLAPPTLPSAWTWPHTPCDSRSLGPGLSLQAHVCHNLCRFRPNQKVISHIARFPMGGGAAKR